MECEPLTRGRGSLWYLRVTSKASFRRAEAAKIKPHPWLRGEESCHGSTHRLGPEDALFFPIAVQRFDLLLRKIDEGPHDDII